MYVCICKKVTDRQIRKAVFEQDIGNLRQLRSCLGACEQCGKCASDARRIVRDANAEKNLLLAHGAQAA
jgi:bacterioferritin-associated ferredoxin